MTTIRSVTALLVIALLAVSVAGCGEDEVLAASGTIEVTAIDYGYVDLPPVVKAGSTFTLKNVSGTELHEFVALRLPDSETRTVEQLVADPASLEALFPNVATVVIAPPNEDGFAVEGTGVLTEPGRYAIICAIPTGADPGEYLAAAAEAEGGPPQVDGGVPHFVSGMYAEVTIVE
ncbi:MAG: hypothetical protein KJP12_02920 [Acidimicrobiia bacterium]|nr:hypothetical protein [Acidimicrobiia bacterium]MBT8214150.1 hypothetical protein [Acidimicrobiia bacterium]NNF70538.1 hypothetical protein [Acidimicrobiia bacterium]